ncbi:uncharacterized protein [Misgurnus anguillicaudatus]|uniref:uncharacterized protein isoform X10 n=1 Tax=Misgurnus anguillicaudatus TaxID=75329 RepID=UPI003CCF12A9
MVMTLNGARRSFISKSDGRRAALLFTLCIWGSIFGGSYAHFRPKPNCPNSNSQSRPNGGHSRHCPNSGSTDKPTEPTTLQVQTQTIKPAYPQTTAEHSITTMKSAITDPSIASPVVSLPTAATAPITTPYETKKASITKASNPTSGKAKDTLVNTMTTTTTSSPIVQVTNSTSQHESKSKVTHHSTTMTVTPESSTNHPTSHKGINPIPSATSTSTKSTTTRPEASTETSVTPTHMSTSSATTTTPLITAPSSIQSAKITTKDSTTVTVSLETSTNHPTSHTGKPNTSARPTSPNFTTTRPEASTETSVTPTQMSTSSATTHLTNAPSSIPSAKITTKDSTTMNVTPENSHTGTNPNTSATPTSPKSTTTRPEASTEITKHSNTAQKSSVPTSTVNPTTTLKSSETTNTHSAITSAPSHKVTNVNLTVTSVTPTHMSTSSATTSTHLTTAPSSIQYAKITTKDSTTMTVNPEKSTSHPTSHTGTNPNTSATPTSPKSTTTRPEASTEITMHSNTAQKSSVPTSTVNPTTTLKSSETTNTHSAITTAPSHKVTNVDLTVTSVTPRHMSTSSATTSTHLITAPSSIPSAKITTKDSTTMTVTPENSTSHPTSPKGMNPNPPVTPQHKKSTTTRPEASTIITMNSNTVQKSSVPTSTVTPKTTLKSLETTNTHSAITTAPSPKITNVDSTVTSVTPTHISTSSATTSTPLTTVPSSIPSAKMTTKDSTTTTVTPENSTSHPTSHKGMNPNPPVTPQHKKSTTTRPEASTIITMNSNTVQKSSVPTSTVTPTTTLTSPETTNTHSAITTAPSIMPTTKVTNHYLTVPSMTPTHMSKSSATTPLTIAPSSIQSAKITPKDSTTVTVTPETSTNHPTSHKPNPSATPTSPKSTRPEASTIITMNSNTMQKLSVHTSSLTTTLKSSETTNAHSELLTSLGITSAYPTTTPLQEPVIFPQTSNGTSHQNDQTKTSTKSPTTMHPSISTTKTATATTSVTPALHSPKKTTRQTFSASPTKKPIGTTISTAIKTSPLPTYTTTAMPKKTTFLNKTPVLTSNLPPVTVPKSTPKVTGSEMVTSLGTTHAYPKTTPLQEPVIIPQTSNGTSHQNDQTKTSTKSPTTMHPSISTTKTATATTSVTPVLHSPTKPTHQTFSASPTKKPIETTISTVIKTSPLPTYTTTAMPKKTTFLNKTQVPTSNLPPVTVPKSTPKVTGSEMLTSLGTTHAYPTTTPLQEPVIIPQTSNGTSHQNDQTKTSTKSPTTMHPSISTTKTATATTSATPVLHLPTQTPHQTSSASPTTKPIAKTTSAAIKTMHSSISTTKTATAKTSVTPVLSSATQTAHQTSSASSTTKNTSTAVTSPTPFTTYTSTTMHKTTSFSKTSPVLTSTLGTKPKSTPKGTVFTSSGATYTYLTTKTLQEPVIIPQTSNETSHPNIPTCKCGIAVVTSTLRFNSSSPVPSQDLVLNAISDLQNSRESQLIESVKVLNITYEKISETSYEVKLTFAVSNITIPVDKEQTNSTLKNLQDVVNVAVNTLLNEPGKAPLQPNSSSFQSTPNQINGSLNYIIRDGDAIQPVSFLQKLQSLKGLSTTSASPLTSSLPVTSVKFVSSSAVVTSTLQFNSPSSVPSKDLVLKAISDLRNSRESQLNESVKLLNVTYEKISETSYEVKLTFAVSNVSMPVDIKQRNSTLTHLQDVANVAVNTLMNEPGKAPLQPNSSSFLSTPNQINGSLNYIIGDGDAIQPVSFLQKLQSLKGSSTTSASPLATSSSPVTSVKFVSGSAVVTSTLQFNSLSPVPSQDLVLKAISDLRNSRESQLNESVKLLNVTYEKISETSYEIKLTFAVSNVSMPVDIKQRNSTLTHLQDVVNVAVNTLLNEPGKAPLQPNSSSFQSTPNQINGSLNYIIRDGDAIQPVSFLQKLQSLKGSSTTSASPLTSSSPVTSVKFVSGSAVVTSTLQFNSPSSVPSKDLVLKAISDLRNSRESQLNESVKLLNVTYEKISENSYEVKLTFAVSNVSMPVDIKQRNSTLTHLQDVVNVAVNTLLNEPGKAPLQPNSSSFLNTPNQINGSLNYIIGDGDAIQPVSFLQKLQSLKGSSTTSASPLATSSSPVTSVKFVSGSAVVTSTLQFNSLSPVPSQDLVLKAISDLRNSRESQLNESVKLLNVTYEKISETSYEIKLTFAVSNVSMPVDIKQRNSTLTHLQDVVNVAVNTLLNEPGKAPLQPNSSSFQSTPNQINGSLNYIIRDGDAIQPVSFLQKLQSLKGSSTTSASPLTSSSPVTSVKFVSGSAVVTSTLQFNSPSSVPSKDLVLKAISDLRNSRESQLNESVKLLNVTYEKISETSYEIKLTFAVSNVSMPVDIKQRNSTLTHLQDVVNVAVNTLLNEPGKAPLQPNSSSFLNTPNQINGSLNYIIGDGDAIQPVSFLQKLQSLKGSSTTSASPLATSHSPVTSGSAVVTSTLQFNSSSPVPSQDLVLKAISDLRNSRESQLNESVKLLNVTYEKISENSYEVKLTFAVSNVSMPVDIKQRNSTLKHLEDVVNVAVNTLLNEPGKASLQPNSSSFLSTPNQINGSLNYIIRDGDAIQPVSFLQKLQSLKGSATTSASPLTTSSSPVTSGSAVVTSTLQFNSSSPVPSKDLVLKAISDLRNSRESQLNESVKLLNVTYEKISETSYEVKFTFAVSNVSMPVDIKQRNSTIIHLQDVVNVAVNTLLNEPGKAPLQPNSSSFQSTQNQINGSLNYIIRDGDAIQPVSFLQKLQSLKGSSTTSASPLATSSSPVTSGSAVVTSTLQFNSSSPVPSKDLVLKAISDLRNSRESKLNESVKLLNVTYEKISETSYEVKFTFAVSNVSMPVDIKQRNSTIIHLQDVVNVAVNTLLNEPGKASLQPNSSSFESTPNHINGSLNYIIRDGDAIQPVSFLQKLQSLKGSSTTSASPQATSSSPVTSGSAVVTSTLQFNSSSPVPSKDLVLKAISDLRNSRESQLNESVKLLNVTYEKISENSYEIKLTFAVSNVSMPMDIKQKNSTFTHLQDVVNVAVNTLLNEPGKAPLQPNSSSFLSTPNHINGSLNYIIRDGDAILPVSFLQKLQSLKGSSTTSASPLATSSSPVTSGSAVVTSTLQFNSSSPVPSKDLVLKAISDLRNSRESQLNESVKLLNVTYEKISENSYEIKLTFAVSNVSMPVDIKQKNSTFTHLQDVVNVAVNTLLNEPGKAPLQPNSSSFLETPNQINGSLNYIIRDVDAIQPVSFLQKLQSLKGSSTTSASPLATSSSPVTSGSAVVTSTLQFNSSSPVPSKDLVLKAISDLRHSRESQLNESVKLLNVTYEKISETCYEVQLTFAVSNVSMPVDIKQRNNTIIHLQDVVNVAVNTLLNEPGKASLQPNSSSFLSTPNQINGSLNYIIRDGDAIQPVSFLQKLQSLKGSSTTSASPLTTSSSPVKSGSAVVTSTLQFNSSSPVPSRDLVLKAISDLRNSRESQLNESVKLLNVTYEKISENSYKVQLTFAVSNVSMPVDIKQRNSTFTHLQDVVNVAVNTLLNEPGKVSLQPNSSSFQSTPNQINGLLNYIIQDGDAIQPVSFLQKFQSLKGSSTTSASPLTTSSSPVNFVLGSAVVTSTLQFNSLSPVPSQDLVYKAISDLRSSRESKLNEPVKLVNVSYTKTSETSYAVLLTFVLSNISMPEKPELRNNTFQLVQDITNNALNTLLNEPGNAILKPNSLNFSSTQNQIVGNMEYDFQTEDTIKPISFLNNLQLPPGLTTTNTPMTNTTSLGDVIIYIRLVFITVKSAPNESTVLQLAYSLLAARLRTKRDVQQLNDPVSFVDVTYQRISDKVFALNFGYIINNVTITQNPVLKNQTLGLVQKSINKLLNEILSSPTATPYQFKQANFTGNSTVIRADVEYVFSDNEITAPSPFIKELILKVNGSITSAPATTTFYPTVVATTGRNNSTSAAWVVAIIVPCAIAIMLIPCWILLCCLLCGCCAAVRRRWDRRRSYNIRYYIHNL